MFKKRISLIGILVFTFLIAFTIGQLSGSKQVVAQNKEKNEVSKITGKESGLAQVIVFRENFKYAGDSYDEHIVYDYQRGTVSRVWIERECFGSSCISIKEVKNYSNLTNK